MSGFQRLVEAELKGYATKAEVAILEGQISRWEAELQAINARLQREYADILAKYGDLVDRYWDTEPDLALRAQEEGDLRAERKRAECLRAQRRLTEISRRIRVSSEVNLGVVTFLRKAIERHRDENANPNASDQALYSALDGRWVE